MKYAQIRNRIKSGDLLAWQGHGFESRIVRAFTGSSYSHVGVAWKIAGRVFVLEASLSGVRIFPLSAKGSFYWVPLDGLGWSSAAEAAAMSPMGERYSRLEAVAGYFGQTFMTRSWQCAEYALAIYAAMGHPVEDVPATPEKVVAYLQTFGNLNYVENGK